MIINCWHTDGTLLLPRVRTSTGQRSFAVFAPATWNSLPPSLRAPELSLSTFKRLLKTHLFQHVWTIIRRRCDWTASSAPHTNIRTQLNSTHGLPLYKFHYKSNPKFFQYLIVQTIHSIMQTHYDNDKAKGIVPAWKWSFLGMRQDYGLCIQLQ